MEHIFIDIWHIEVYCLWKYWNANLNHSLLWYADSNVCVMSKSTKRQ